MHTGTGFRPLHIASCRVLFSSFSFREIDQFSEEASLLKLLCFLSEKGSTLKVKENVLYGSEFIYLRVDHCSEGIWYAMRQSKSHKNCLS